MYLHSILSGLLAVVWIGGLWLSVRGWRWTGRPVFAGVMWFFGLGIASPIWFIFSAKAMSGMVFRLQDAPELLKLLSSLLGLSFTLMTTLALWLVLRGALAEEQRAADGGEQS